MDQLALLLLGQCAGEEPYAQRKSCFWLMLLGVLVCSHLALSLGSCGKEEHYGGEGNGTKLITLWWPGSRGAGGRAGQKKKRRRRRRRRRWREWGRGGGWMRQAFQGQTLSDLTFSDLATPGSAICWESLSLQPMSICGTLKT